MIENLAIGKDEISKRLTIKGIRIFFNEQYVGFYFTKRIAIYRHKWIEFYEISYKSAWFEIDFVGKERIFTEKDSISAMPKRVVLETEDIDFLRAVFAAGKKVSWYNPDWTIYSNYFMVFNFERLFLNPFRVGMILLANGEVHRIGRDNIDLSIFKIGNYGRKIGYSEENLMNTNDQYKLRIDRLKKYGEEAVRKKVKISRFLRLSYFNILSLTYMLCRKSIATHVQKKNAPLE
jgi:hypothetical protein